MDGTVVFRFRVRLDRQVKKMKKRPEEARLTPADSVVEVARGHSADRVRILAARIPTTTETALGMRTHRLTPGARGWTGKPPTTLTATTTTPPSTPTHPRSEATASTTTATATARRPPAVGGLAAHSATTNGRRPAPVTEATSVFVTTTARTCGAVQETTASSSGPWSTTAQPAPTPHANVCPQDPDTSCMRTVETGKAGSAGKSIGVKKGAIDSIGRQLPGG